MKQILYIIVLAFIVASCGPSRHAIHVEMRHPSKAGIEFAGKNVAVVHLENDNPFSNSLSDTCEMLGEYSIITWVFTQL